MTHAGPGAPTGLIDRPMAARVPGTVHLDLQAAGAIPDPLLDRNEEHLHWIGLSDWSYTVPVTVDPAGFERVDLVFDGVDTVAEIRWDERLLGSAANMHRPHRFDITDLIGPTPGRLRVDLRSPVQAALDSQDRFGVYPHTEHHPYNQLRKMACNFGWDWGPDVATVGLWRPVRIECWSVARLAAVRPSTGLGPGGGRLRLDVDLEWAGAGDCRLTATVAGVRVETSVPAGTRTVRLDLEVPEAEPWWPRSLGPQPLYEVTIDLATDQGLALDRTRRMVGFRTVLVDTTPDQSGSRWAILVNDTPVWVRGANWIPDDVFPCRVGPERYRERIEQACEAGIDLLRVWGGGIYESDDFYEVCDRLGVMVWQDFLFSCAAYPEHDELTTEIEAEVRAAIDRLMGHPSLVLWNGNNENLWGRLDWGWEEPLAGRPWGAGYYYDLLPRLLGELDPDRPYIPGSPYSSPHLSTIHPNDPRHGVMHIWDVWNTRDYPGYRDYDPGFVAEFGFQGPPTWATLVEALGDERLDPDSPGLAHRQKAADGMRKLHRGLEAHFRAPETFDDWHFLTQLNQARAVSTGIEWFRSRHRCSGSVMWQLNDCWPVISWAAVDGGGRKKPLWYALRRAYADRLVTIQPEGDGLNAVLHNLGGETWSAETRIRRVGADGRVLADETHTVEAPPGALIHLPIGPDLARPRDETAELLVADVGGLRSIWTWVPDHGLRLPPGRIEVAAEERGEGVVVTVRAETIVRDLCLFVDRIDGRAEVDEMLVTLLPGETQDFVVSGVGSDSISRLTEKPVLRHLEDSLSP